MKTSNNDIANIRNEILYFEKELNAQINRFKTETGLPVLLSISKPSQVGLGETPEQYIKVNVLI